VVEKRSPACRDPAHGVVRPQHLLQPPFGSGPAAWPSDCLVVVSVNAAARGQRQHTLHSSSPLPDGLLESKACPTLPRVSRARCREDQAEPVEGQVLAAISLWECASSARSHVRSLALRLAGFCRPRTTNNDDSPSQFVGSPYLPLTGRGGCSVRYLAFSAALL
jgi:hypothetical protein